MTLMYKPIPIHCPRCDVFVCEILPPSVSYATMGQARDEIIEHWQVYHGGRPGLAESLNLFQDVKEQCGLGGL